MKAIITLILVLFFGALALAQNTQKNDTVEPTQMGIVLDSGIDHIVHTKKVKTFTQESVVRLYKFKNSRVKKALAFTTKKDRPRLA